MFDPFLRVCLLLLVVVVIGLGFATSLFLVEGADTSPSAASEPVPEKTHNVVASYYDVDDFPSAKLLLNNKDIVAREVRPTLYSMDGISFEPPPVVLAPNSHQLVDLDEWASLGGENFRRGSIRLFYTGKDLNIGSQIYLEDDTKSLSFEERFVEIGKFNTQQLEGIWRMPSNQTQVTIILSNTSEQPISVNVRLSRNPNIDGETQSFSLFPHQTRVLDLRNDFNDGETVARGNIVGLSLDHNGNASDLKVHGQVKDERKGYSNIIQFTNPNSAKSSELHGTGLHLGMIGGERLEPFVALKNVGKETASVEANFHLTLTDGSSETVRLNERKLKTGEMRYLNVDQIIQRAKREKVEIAGLEVKYDTEPGSVLVNVQSVSESGRQVFRVPMGDPYGQVSSTGGYPWRIDPTSSTYTYIKNMTDQEQEYVAYLTWEGGEYMIGLNKITPQKTVQIDVKNLRDQQIPDERGTVIPANVNYGQIKWTIRSDRFSEDEPLKKFALTGRSEQIDLEKGTSTSYACQNCCQGWANGWISSGGITQAEVGDQIQFSAYEWGTDCFGNPYNYQINNDYVDWSSSNNSIATVSNLGLVTIIAPGNFEIDGDWWVTVTDDYGGWCPGPYLVEPEPEPVRSGPSAAELESLTMLMQPDCDACYSTQRQIDDQVALVAKPKVTITVPATAKDGDTVTFSVTTQGGTPTSYQWTYSVDSGSTGNTPNIAFGSPTSASTTAAAHWYARPNSPCPGTPPDPSTSHPYYNSKYKVKIKVTFDGGSEVDKDKDFTVNAWWSPAGAVDVPQLTGSIQMTQNAQNQWIVVGHSLSRSPQSAPTMYVPQSSQFYSKTLTHENEHISQFGSGQIFANYVTVSAFWTYLTSLNLSSPTQQGLLAAVGTAVDNYRQSERNRARTSGDLNQAEIDAYAVSDPVAPMFAYQRCGRTSF